MKSERRHKLQTNTLAQALSDFPTWWKDFGSKAVLWGALIIVLAVVLYYRFSGNKAANLQDLQSLATLRERADMLRFVPSQEQPALTPQQLQTDSSSADDLLAGLKQLKDGTSDNRVKAEALVEMGDIDWNLANLPIADPADSTLVSFPPDRAKFLDSARTSYQAVADQYSDQPLSYATARFGLAAVAESNHDFNTARDQYQAIDKAFNVDQVLKQRAEARLAVLPQLERGIYLGKAQTYEPFVMPDNIRLPSSQSTTGPAPTTGPFMPAVLPTPTPTTTAVQLPALPMPASATATTQP